MRDFQKLKTLADWQELDAPIHIDEWAPTAVPEEQMVLRMLVRPKYGEFHIPEELRWLEHHIHLLAEHDAKLTGITNSWCYVTVRSGLPQPTTDEWHFDGGSLRVELIPERNYVWCNRSPLQYKMGGVAFPTDFDPVRHNMFTYAQALTGDEELQTVRPNEWYLLTPFCLHRRDPASTGIPRTFVRVSFVDIEIRDANCTQNPLFPTEAYGRNPVTSFRDQLEDY